MDSWDDFESWVPPVDGLAFHSRTDVSSKSKASIWNCQVAVTCVYMCTSLISNVSTVDQICVVYK